MQTQKQSYQIQEFRVFCQNAILSSAFIVFCMLSLSVLHLCLLVGYKLQNSVTFLSVQKII